MSDSESSDERRVALRQLDELVAEWTATNPWNSDELSRMFRRFLELSSRSGVAWAEDPDFVLRKFDELNKYFAAQREMFAELDREPTPEEQMMRDFIDKLSARQATIVPDFDALYKRKAEIDRNLDEPKS